MEKVIEPSSVSNDNNKKKTHIFFLKWIAGLLAVVIVGVVVGNV